METVSTRDFMSRASERDVGFDPQSPESRCLRLLRSLDQSRFWTLPPYPETWPHFVASFVNCLDDWETGYLWPRAGSWPKSGQSQSHKGGVMDVLLRGAGVPSDWAGAIRFRRDEENLIVAIAYAFIAFGWCGDDDLFFVPDHGRQIVRTDHHDVIHIECLSEERILTFVSQMSEKGYELPVEVPDWTFFRPAWMKESQRSG